MNKEILRNFVWFPILAILVVMFGTIPAELLRLVFGGHHVTFDFVVFTLSLGFGGIAAVVFLIVKFREKRTLADLGIKRENAFKEYFKGFGLGMLFMGVAALVIFFLGGFKVDVTAEGIGLVFLPTILFTLIGWTVQGSTEELLVRGWMLPQLSKRYNIYVGAAISSLFFTVLHLGNNGVTFMALLNLTLFAVFATLYAVYSNSILAICGFHVSWNFMQGNLLGIEVSGSQVPGGALIKLQGVGNELISGGAFGVEGSIICSILFIGASIYLLIKIKAKHESLDSIEIY